MRTQRKWLVDVKTPSGQLKTRVLHFEPKVNAKLDDGSIVVKVHNATVPRATGLSRGE
jgi:hypothetical protein